ncbi:MAG: preprotein translocase subunit YajC [Acidimicrobiia bacterium]
MFSILAGEVAEPAASGWATLVIYAVVIGGLFYFLMIRPQRTRMKRHEALVGALAVGDEIQTIGGIYGVIESIDEATAVIAVEGGGRLRVAKRALAGKVSA